MHSVTDPATGAVTWVEETVAPTTQSKGVNGVDYDLYDTPESEQKDFWLGNLLVSSQARRMGSAVHTESGTSCGTESTMVFVLLPLEQFHRVLLDGKTNPLTMRDPGCWRMSSNASGPQSWQVSAPLESVPTQESFPQERYRLSLRL